MGGSQAKPLAFKLISVVLVLSGVTEVVVSFYVKGIVSSALLASGLVEILVGAFFWFWADRKSS